MNEAGIELERQEIRLPDGPLRELGEHAVDIHIHTDVEAILQVVVESGTVIETPEELEEEMKETAEEAAPEEMKETAEEAAPEETTETMETAEETAPEETTETMETAEDAETEAAEPEKPESTG